MVVLRSHAVLRRRAGSEYLPDDETRAVADAVHHTKSSGRLEVTCKVAFKPDGRQTSLKEPVSGNVYLNEVGVLTEA